MDISPAPGGAAEPQGQVVQGSGQLPSDRGVGQGQAAGKPDQAPGTQLLPAWHASGSCYGASGRGAGGQSVGAPADGALGRHTEAVERATTAIGCYVNKPVKSPLHSEKMKIW